MGRFAAAALVLAVVACARAADPLPDPLPGYSRTSGDEHASLMAVVVEYYAERQRAVLFGNATLLFAAYPELARGEDLRQGINLDALFVRLMRDDGVTKVTDELERYESVRIYVNGASAVAFVHGVESWHYPHGGPGSGEFFTRIDLVHDAGGWSVQRTDEQMMSERPPRTPRP